MIPKRGVGAMAWVAPVLMGSACSDAPTVASCIEDHPDGPDYTEEPGQIRNVSDYCKRTRRDDTCDYTTWIGRDAALCIAGVCGLDPESTSAHLTFLVDAEVGAWQLRNPPHEELHVSALDGQVVRTRVREPLGFCHRGERPD